MMDSGNNNMASNFSQLVECPRCGNHFELSETFRAQFQAEKRREIDLALRDNEVRIHAEAEKASQAKLAETAEQVKTLETQLQADQEAHEKREAEIRADAEKASQAKLAETAEQVKTLETQLQADQEAHEKREAEIRADAEKASQAKLAETAEQVKTLETQLQADQEAHEKREAEIRADAEKDATRKFDIEREEYAIEKQRLEKQMADMQRQIGQKPAELQGEALEVYLKRQLNTNFPVDRIEDVNRGQYGADLTQEVIDGQLGACGKVVWEAKRTKRWNDDWLGKIKEDADRVGAHLRVIVSETLPSDVRNFELKEGVWISNIDCALPLAMALRSQLIESTRLQRAGQGKGLKMDEIYRYLTSPRFGERIQRMVETWKALEEQVNSEERSMRRQWKERRKQLAKMQDSTIELFTDFSAILGKEIPQVPGLELDALPPGEILP